MTSKKKAIEGDDFNRRKATEDDVEGHSFAKRAAVEGEGLLKRMATEDDVEGHALKSRSAVEPDGHGKHRATEDDVEGHALKSRSAVEPDGHGKHRVTEDDDVEGHNIGVMNPILARELSRARERDVQREASRNSLIGEAKRALGRKR